MEGDAINSAARTLKAARRAEATTADRSPPGAQGRREEILVTACELFYSRGFAKASMRDLAQGIGVTQAAIYYHFKSKEDILLALIEGFTEYLRATLERALHATGDPVEDLRRTIRTHILLSRTHYREIKLVTEDKRLLGPAYADRVRRRELTIYTLYRERVADLIATGRLARLSPSVIVFNTLAMINFVFQWYRPNGSLRLEEIADQTVTMLMHGLLSHHAPARPRSRDRAVQTQTPEEGGDR